MAAAAMDAAPQRRLYEHGFEGWDISQGCYATDYLVMVAGLSCALLAYEKLRSERSWATLPGLLSQFALFALLQGVGAGFRGITHHLLDTFMEDGHSMGRRWGAPHAEWLFAWLLALVILPLASAACLGTSLAYGELGVEWIKAAWGLGALAAVFESYLCLSDQIDASGAISVYWGAIVSVIASLVVFRRGTDVPGLWQIFLGNLLRVAGYAVLMTAPAGCKRAGAARLGCPYPAEFDHNAVCHVLLAASVVSIYVGADAKNTKDKEVSYWETLKRGERRDDQKDRMCSLGW